MSIDDLARAAASDARRTASREVDLTASLARLHRTRRRRNVSSVAGVVVAVLAVVLGGGALLSQRAGTTQVTPPGASQQPSGTGSGCYDDPAITCVGSGRFRVALPVPMTVTLPVNFQQHLSLLNTSTVEAYRSDIGSTGVTVFENAVPVRYDASWTADPAAGTSAQAMATWLSKRPFLANARVTPTTVGGRKAWRVSGDLRPDVTLPASKDGEPAAPTFLDGDATAAYSRTIIGEYTLLDLPGAGVTVIWSWAVDHASQVLADNQSLVDGLTFD